MISLKLQNFLIPTANLMAKIMFSETYQKMKSLEEYDLDLSPIHEQNAH